MQQKIRVYYFHNGSGGGVLSVIQNLLLHKQHPQIENNVIYTINKDTGKSFKPFGLNGAATEQVFYYSPKWNFYHTCIKLAKLLPDENAVIVANDWLELGMVSYKGLNNPVVQILHGDYGYYYELSLKHSRWINVCITVAEAMATKLCNLLPGRIHDIFYLPFPVPDISPKSSADVSMQLQIIFVGRLTKEKGYDLLPLIENALRNKSVQVKWHIVGDATENERSIWPADSEVAFYGQLPNQRVVDIMRQTDCLVLPSLAEGMPVTVVEAMKIGLTCLINDLPGGVQELIIEGVTGYKIKGNEIGTYAEVIELLNSNRVRLKSIGESARAIATSQFDPNINTKRYEQLIEMSVNKLREHRKPAKVYGSRLDAPWIPNFVTKNIRSFW